jgi:hypothetical protein
VPAQLKTIFAVSIFNSFAYCKVVQARAFRGCTTSFGLLCNIQGFFVLRNMKLTQIVLSKHHQTDTELCYKRQGSKVFLYDDTTAPRLLIATISGNDLDGWQWSGDCPKLVEFWQQEPWFGRWRAALMDAVMAYIN